MARLDNLDTIGYGKIYFIPRNHTVPALPDMNLLVLKDKENFQAICIDIELDSTGDSAKTACNNLKKRLLAYTTQMVHNNNNDIKAAAEEIISIAYTQGETKAQLFNMYKQAKRQYLLNRLENKRKAKSRKEEFLNALNRVFQLEPISLNLTLAAGVV